MTPCKGLYADVEKDNDYEKVSELKKLGNIFDSYENYKRGFSIDIEYPEMISGKFFSSYAFHH